MIENNSIVFLFGVVASLAHLYANPVQLLWYFSTVGSLAVAAHAAWFFCSQVACTEWHVDRESKRPLERRERLFGSSLRRTVYLQSEPRRAYHQVLDPGFVLAGFYR